MSDDEPREEADVRRRKATKGFMSTGDDAPGEGAIDESGQLRSGDRERDPATHRRTPTIPGVRVSKSGQPQTHFPPRGTPGWKRKGEIHPRRRKYRVHSAKGPRRPSYADASELIPRLLGPKRIALLRASLAKRGAMTKPERAARVYLAVLLRHLDSTAANRAAVDLLGGDLRKIGDLRRRMYDEVDLAAAGQELRDCLRLPR